MTVAIDRRGLAQLRAAVGESAFADIALEFVQDTKRLEDALRGASMRCDVRAVRAAAHELHGLAGTFGARELAAACGNLSSDDALRFVGAAIDAAVRARTQMQKLLRTRGAA